MAVTFSTEKWRHTVERFQGQVVRPLESTSAFAKAHGITYDMIDRYEISVAPGQQISMIDNRIMFPVYNENDEIDGFGLISRRSDDGSSAIHVAPQTLSVQGDQTPSLDTPFYPETFVAGRNIILVPSPLYVWLLSARGVSNVTWSTGCIGSKHQRVLKECTEDGQRVQFLPRIRNDADESRRTFRALGPHCRVEELELPLGECFSVGEIVDWICDYVSKG